MILPRQSSAGATVIHGRHASLAISSASTCNNLTLQFLRGANAYISPFLPLSSFLFNVNRCPPPSPLGAHLTSYGLEKRRSMLIFHPLEGLIFKSYLALEQKPAIGQAPISPQIRFLQRL